MPPKSLSVAGSAERFRLTEYLGRQGNVPADVGESFDWAVRTDPSWPNISKNAAQRKLFDNLVEQRAAVLCFEHRIPKEFGFDMAYVRWPSEVEYVYLLHDLLTSGIVANYEV